MATQNMIESAYSPTPTATTIAQWDTNKNLSANNHLEGYATTATAAGTTTLAVGSAKQQFFTGSTTQTVVLPVTSTLVLGQSFYIVNNSSGVVTVQSSGANTIQAMAANTTLLATCILTSGTTAASWSIEYVGATSGGTVNSGTANQFALYVTSGTAVSGSLNLLNNGTNLKPVLTLFDIGSTAVNSFEMFNNATSGGITLSAIGSDSNIATTITGKGTSGVNVAGFTDASNAPAGYVREMISSIIPIASGVTLTSTTPGNVTSISVTAGDWDIFGNVTMSPTVSMTDGACWISLTSATLPDASLYNRSISAQTLLGLNTPSLRVNVNSTTIVYLSARTTHTGTMTACGGIYARRR